MSGCSAEVAITTAVTARRAGFREQNFDLFGGELQARELRLNPRLLCVSHDLHSLFEMVES